MKNTFQVRVLRRGVITLPKQLRAHNKIQEGEALTLTNLSDGVMILSARRSRVDEIADQLATDWRDSGETLESMLTTLRDVRGQKDAPKRP